MQPTSHLCRRRFLQSTVAVAACGLVRPGRADEDDATSIIDTHVYVGRWPLARLADDEPAKIVAALRRHGVSQAWAGNLEALFHKDIHGTNLRLIEICHLEGQGVLTPVGAVNPTLPDWEEDLRRCHEEFRIPAIRLHPSYHGYELDDPRFTRLLELAAARGLIVHLVARLTGVRRLLLTPKIPQVDLAPLPRVLRSVSSLRLLVTNSFRTAEDQLFRELLRQPGVYFDFAESLTNPNFRDLVERISADRVVFGSSAPLADVRSELLKLRRVQLTASQLRAIRMGTAQRMIEGLVNGAVESLLGPPADGLFAQPEVGGCEN